MLNHKNIIKLYQGFVIKNELLLIMEYADGGELVNYVEEKKGLPELECRSLFKQLISAIDCCHSQGIIHRDMKLENVLFESKARTRLKIVDFGIAGRCTPTINDKTDAGTLRFMAPEVLGGLDLKASPAIDIWALGIMLYCMLFYKFPFNGDTAH
jgi:serine/threonine protein kinase